MEKIILASSSSRRRNMLKKYNMFFDTIVSDIAENINENKFPEATVMSLAFQKAIDVSKKIDSNNIIIAADTIVYLNGEIIGKPKNEVEAKEILKKLSGQTHSVYTGIAIIRANTNEKIVDYYKTEVKFRKLDDEMIEKYISISEYVDKAGGYGIQDKGELFVESINGSYSNVVGLPIVKLDVLLKKYFQISLM
ncbi:septum formation protein Maf [Clostridium sp. D2Q-14]|uniref:nucleoside triphosphate pyrophosphatase n=1 Tax=Anaeromonas gelatinilytica TaxID=2683194 RepID=UPI00193C4ED8|nr:Maf family protein [Anaeromonas gelatinilytica]MBS4535874.1 septum formation protein Maf [Anaeromonas gelatinilytica]